MPAVDQVRVLIVDDDPLDREIYRRYLGDARGRQILVAEADCGTSAQAQIREFQPNCMLLDFNLPDMTGLELLAALKDSAGGYPCAVVIFTSLRDERVAVAAMKTGIMDYLGKSETSAEALLHSIDNAIAKFQMLRQIEEQRRALEASEQRYRMLAEVIPQIVWTAQADGSLEYANRRWFEFGGWPRNLEWDTLLAPQDQQDFHSCWGRVLASGSAFEIEQRLSRHSDGSSRWHLIRALPIRGANGEILRWFGTCTDIEDRKRAEATVLEKQKLESLGLLAGGIAHDFNNLLVGILGGASHAVESLPATHQLQPVLQNVVLAGERAAHLIRQMLAYAGKGHFVVERVDLNELVRETCDLIRASIPKSVQLNVQRSHNLPWIETDAGQMQQVVMNLVINAAEAMPETGGTVLVETTEQYISEEYLALHPFQGAAVAPGYYVELQVRDTGSGMDEETRSKIFDPFFSTKFAGRGLGLAAVQGILRTNRGGIYVESTPGKGSTFHVLVPAVYERSKEPGSEASADRCQGGAILVVDDERVVRETAKAILRRRGYQVMVADGGPEAIRLLRQEGQAIALVLLDMNMPDMPGREVLREFRRMAPAVPVVICSGYSESEVHRHFAGLSPSGILQKPFTAARLLESVEAFYRGGCRSSSVHARNVG